MKFTTITGLWIGFAVLLLSLVLGGYLVDRNIRSIDRVVALEEIHDSAVEMEINLLGTGMAVVRYLQTGEPEHRARVMHDGEEFRMYKARYERRARTERERRLAKDIGSRYEQYYVVSRTLMDTKDKQNALLDQVTGEWDQIDRLVDERVQPGIGADLPNALLLMQQAADIETEIAEVSNWLRNYLQSSQAHDRQHMAGDAWECRQHLANFRRFSRTREHRDWAVQMEMLFEQSMVRVDGILELEGILQTNQRNFRRLSRELDDILDDHIQEGLAADLQTAKVQAEETVKYLRLASFALLGIGLAITIAAMATIVRRSGQLETSNRELQMRVAERERAEEQIRASREQLRALSAHLSSVREEERKRIAREIHDELGQLVTSMILELSWLEEKLAAADGAPSPLLLDRIRALLQLADITVDAVRRIATELRTGLLDDFGLVAAVEWQARDFQRHTGVVCDLVISVDETELDPACSTALFRIFQEALTNVARHAEATSVSVVLEQNERDLVLQVEDNGKGIPEEVLADERSLGIMGMRERAMLLGGDVKIERPRNRGTRVTATIPRIPQQKADDAARHPIAS